MELKSYKTISRNTGQHKCQYYEWPGKQIGEREMRKERVLNSGLQRNIKILSEVKSDPCFFTGADECHQFWFSFTLLKGFEKISVTKTRAIMSLWLFSLSELENHKGV